MRDTIVHTKKGDTITIGATTETYCDPDIVKVSIEYRGEHETKEECISDYRAAVNRVRKALESCEISGDDHKGEPLEIYPCYEALYEKVSDKKYEIFTEALFRRNQLFKGYEYAAKSGLELAFDGNIENVEKLWRALSQSNVELNIGFDLKDREGVRDTLVEPAVKQARHRAELYASAAGCRLGAVYHISGDGGYVEFCRRKGCYDDESGLVPLFEPEPIEVTCHVEVEWYLHEL